MQDTGTTKVESAASLASEGAGRGSPAWLKLGAIAAASALTGGLAAAWYYRKTLISLREAQSDSRNPEFRIPDSETEYDNSGAWADCCQGQQLHGAAARRRDDPIHAQVNHKLAVVVHHVGQAESGQS